MSNIPIKDKLGDDRLFKIARFKEKIKRTKPHKHDGYHELIYINQGEGFHWLDTGHYKISPPEIYFLKPGSLHCWQFTAIPKGFVILFRESYFDPIKEQNILELLQQMDTQLQISLKGEFQPFPIFEEILREYTQDTTHSDLIIHGYLQALLSKILHLSQSDLKKAGPGSLLPERFLKLLSEKCPQWRLVHQYAAQLNTSPQNLNAACRKHTGKSAGEHIAEQVLLEAKRHLLHTDEHINQIAYHLHFNDASYFIKFFKKYTGQTPAQFRRRFFQ